MRWKKTTIFLVLTASSITLAFILSIIAKLKFGYNMLVIFPIVMTSEGVILAIYQTLFVKKELNPRFVTAEVEHVRRLYEIAIQMTKLHGTEKQKLIDEIEQIGEQLEKKTEEFEDQGRMPSLEPIDEAIEEYSQSIENDNSNEPRH